MGGTPATAAAESLLVVPKRVEKRVEVLGSLSLSVDDLEGSEAGWDIIFILASNVPVCGCGIDMVLLPLSPALRPCIGLPGDFLYPPSTVGDCRA